MIRNQFNYIEKSVKNTLPLGAILKPRGQTGGEGELVKKPHLTTRGGGGYIKKPRGHTKFEFR